MPTEQHDTGLCQCKTCDAKRVVLWNHVTSFVQDQKISCSESVYQTDRIIENAYEFIEGCCDIVGYCDDDEED